VPKKIRPLSDLAIRASKPGQKMLTLYDGEGLQLRVLTSGSKVWIFNYVRPYLKTRNNIKLGTYPTMALAQARQLREQYRQLLAAGTDPQRWLERQSHQASTEALNTFQNACRKWFEVRFAKISKRYSFNIQRSFELHVFPKAGHVPLKDLNAKYLIESLRPLEQAQKLETLSRLCQRINEFMIWCVNTGLLEFNHSNGINAAFIRPTHENMRTIRPDELPELMQRLNTGDIALPGRCLVEWQLHTMVRPGEAVKARWQDIDFANSIWNIPAKFMKMRRGHVVPLTKQSIAILQLMRQLNSDSPYVFPSLQNTRLHLCRDTANNALKKIGYEQKLVAHGMRSLASTVLNEHSFNSDWIEAALSHVDKNDIRATYNNAIYLKPRKKMMSWWSNYIEKAANGRLCTDYAAELLRLAS
jgi:integrase